MAILETPHLTIPNVIAMCNNLDTVGAVCLQVAFRYELDFFGGMVASYDKKENHC